MASHLVNTPMFSDSDNSSGSLRPKFATEAVPQNESSSVTISGRTDLQSPSSSCQKNSIVNSLDSCPSQDVSRYDPSTIHSTQSLQHDFTSDVSLSPSTGVHSKTNENFRSLRACRLRNRFRNIKLTYRDDLNSDSEHTTPSGDDIMTSSGSSSVFDDADVTDESSDTTTKRKKKAKTSRNLASQARREKNATSATLSNLSSRCLSNASARYSHTPGSSGNIGFTSRASYRPLRTDRYPQSRHPRDSTRPNSKRYEEDKDDDDSSLEFRVKRREDTRKRMCRAASLQPSPIETATRTSTRRATMCQFNFSQWLQSSSSTDDSDDDSASYTPQGEDPVVMCTVKKVIGYRRVDSPEDTEPSLIPLPLKDGNEETLSDVTFFVKWLFKSHLHNSWCTYKYLVDSKIGGIRKVDNFFRKIQRLREEREYMTEDEIERQNISLEFQRQIELDSLIAERLVAHRVEDHPASLSSHFDVNPNVKQQTSNDQTVHYTASPKHKGEVSFQIKTETNQSQEKSSIPVDMYFVKWCNTRYDQCTWETKDLLLEHGFKNLIEEFHSRESRICGPDSAYHPLHRHALCRTSFQPYERTPSYLCISDGGELRDYQLTGLNWMVSRMKKGFSVLLADEMGLGKTVQTISVVGHMMFVERIVGPYLIVVPQSTADNWLSEFKRWLPLANVIVYHGNPASRDIIRTYEMSQVHAHPYRDKKEYAEEPRALANRIDPTAGRSRYRFDVCICTFSILNNLDELILLRNMEWYFMAIDEAHLLKNRKSRRFRELNSFKAQYRVLLSGTPLHNNLDELWSLLHFLCPRLYQDIDRFKERYSEIERTDSVGILKEKQLATLQSELNELVLRRVKKDVEKSLPRKIERILRVELSPQQSQCCKAIISRNYQALARSTGTSKASLQNICMELKKACNHPLLLQNDVDITALQSTASLSSAHREEWHHALLHTSGKLALLDKLLPYLKERQHRVLVFSQMVRMLNILSIYLTLRGFKHQRLDGTMTREVRKKAIDHFNSADSDDFCFLLSTRAGGLGINLTTADTVIVYDSDWNPQNDLQAVARAHRIGQTKTVQIYRLVSKDTIEERILERAKTKMVLDTLVVQGLNKRENEGVSSANLKAYDPSKFEPVQKSGFSKEELTRILKFGASKLWRSSTLATGTTDGSAPQTNSQPILLNSASKEGEHVVDLDRILAEAEENTSEGFADQLLSSFTNISDFSYTASHDPAEYDDAYFWENAIPPDERKKYEQSDNLLFTKRKRKQVQRHGVVSLDFVDRYEDEDDFHFPDDSSRGSYGMGTTGGTSKASSGGASQSIKKKTSAHGTAWSVSKRAPGKKKIHTESTQENTQTNDHSSPPTNKTIKSRTGSRTRKRGGGGPRTPTPQPADGVTTTKTEDTRATDTAHPSKKMQQSARHLPSRAPATLSASTPCPTTKRSKRCTFVPTPQDIVKSDTDNKKLRNKLRQSKRLRRVPEKSSASPPSSNGAASSAVEKKPMSSEYVLNRIPRRLTTNTTK